MFVFFKQKTAYELRISGWSSDVCSSDLLPGTIIAAAFILLGAVFWWDTKDMSDPDSYVFPRSIIVLMIAFSLLLILRNLAFGGGRPRSADEGSWPRRIGLVAVMLLGALAMRSAERRVGKEGVSKC